MLLFSMLLFSMLLFSIISIRIKSSNIIYSTNYVCHVNSHIIIEVVHPGLLPNVTISRISNNITFSFNILLHINY